MLITLLLCNCCYSKDGRCLTTPTILSLCHLKSVVRSPERSFEKCMGTLGGHRGHLHKVRKVYGDPKGSLVALILVEIGALEEIWGCLL